MNSKPNVLLIVTLAHFTPQTKPFKKENENQTYEHISLLCKQQGVNLYVAHFANLTESSKVLSWIFKDGSWNMVKLPASSIKVAYADLPQNFPEANELRDVLVNHDVFFINDLRMSDSLTDKVLTHSILPGFLPPTFNASLSNLSAQLLESSNHPDLRTDKVVLKPRYGERGKGIEVIDFSEIDSQRLKNLDDYIVQPFMESNIGIPELGITGRHDLRMLIHDGKIMDFFVRVASTDGYLCNQLHGGQIAYFPLDMLPERFKVVAREVDQSLNQYMPRYYSVDVGVGQSGKIWVYELNTMPGVVWNAEGTDKARYFGMHQSIVDSIMVGISQKQAL